MQSSRYPYGTNVVRAHFNDEETDRERLGKLANVMNVRTGRGGFKSVNLALVPYSPSCLMTASTAE